MSGKLCALILDALGPYTMRSLDLDYVLDLYRSDDTASGLMACSGLAHTPISNALMWGDYHNDDTIWMRTHPHRWEGGIGEFDPTIKEYNDAEPYTREDYDTNFVWDVLDHHGYDATALGIPICLPPYSYNADVRLEDAWFPHTEEGLAHHVRMKPRFVEHHAIKGDDFICCSIKVPDQWLHGQGSGIVSDGFVESEVPVLEQRLERMIRVLEGEGYDWIVFGDHGAPYEGRTANFTTKKLLARHRKEAAIIGTTDEVPRYTGEMYGFLLDYFGVGDVDEPLERGPEEPAPGEGTEHVPMETLLALDGYGGSTTG